MNIKHLPLHLGLGLALAVSGVVAQTSLARAQSGNQSDITGVIVTTSDIVGGFNPGGGRRRIIAFRTSQIQDAANDAAVSINQQLGLRTLPVVATDTRTAISAAVQQNLEFILTNSSNVDASVTLIVNNLVSAGADRTLAQNLVSSLVGLTASGRVSARQFLIVTRTYNAFIQNSPIELFTDNPDSLRAIRAILSILLNATFASR